MKIAACALGQRKNRFARRVYAARCGGQLQAPGHGAADKVPNSDLDIVVDLSLSNRSLYRSL